MSFALFLSLRLLLLVVVLALVDDDYSLFFVRLYGYVNVNDDYPITTTITVIVLTTMRTKKLKCGNFFLLNVFNFTTLVLACCASINNITLQYYYKTNTCAAMWWWRDDEECNK